MEMREANLDIIATRRSQYPDQGKPEFLLVGRSNVGKSSLINMLTKKNKLAKTSSTPGRTRLINYFLINLALFIFNSLPIGTLDGGRILFAVLNKVFKTLKIAEFVFDIISFFTVSLLILLAFYAFFKSGYNVSLVITSIYLLLMLLNRQRC